jgi:hypothetical protein
MQRIVGLIFIILGIILTLDFLNIFGQRTLFGILSLMGPVILVTGGVLILGQALSRSILIVGIVLLIVGGFPWIYTPYLMGTRGGDEGSGMFGTIIFILVGLPGLLMTIIGFIWVFFGRE